MSNKQRFSTHARIRARRAAVQALYQWHITEDPLEDIVEEFENEAQRLTRVDRDYFRQLVSGVGEYKQELESLMVASLDRDIEQLDPVEHSILCLSVYELAYQPEVPLRVVINESIELAKMFGAEESYTYINGILDKVARVTRKDEAGNAVNC